MGPSGSLVAPRNPSQSLVTLGIRRPLLLARDTFRNGQNSTAHALPECECYEK